MEFLLPPKHCNALLLLLLLLHHAVKRENLDRYVYLVYTVFSSFFSPPLPPPGPNRPKLIRPSIHPCLSSLLFSSLLLLLPSSSKHCLRSVSSALSVPTPYTPLAHPTLAHLTRTPSPSPPLCRACSIFLSWMCLCGGWGSTFGFLVFLCGSGEGKKGGEEMRWVGVLQQSVTVVARG